MRRVRDLPRTLLVLAGASWPVAGHGQNWTLQADLTLASAYEWRGIRMDDGPILSHAAYASLRWRRTGLTAGVWALTDLSPRDRNGFQHRWAPETSPWLEAAGGGIDHQVFVGVTGYWLRPLPSGLSARRVDSWELYGGARGSIPGAPLTAEGVLFWDVDRIRGGYGELSAALQIPLWVGAMVPIGSIFLECRSGFTFGQEQGTGNLERGVYLFGEAGATHTDLSLRTTLLPVAIGPSSVSLSVAGHWTRGLDRETVRIGAFTGGPVDRARWRWALGLRFTAPRCRPEKELCPDL